MMATIITVIEIVHAEPANMGKAAPALHVHTPIVFLDGDAALGAVSDVVIGLVLRQRPQPPIGMIPLIVCAGDSLMLQNVAARADWG
jgi:hypothetical protein